MFLTSLPHLSSKKEDYQNCFPYLTLPPSPPLSLLLADVLEEGQ